MPQQPTRRTPAPPEPLPPRETDRSSADSDAGSGDAVWRVVQQHQAPLVRYAAHLTGDAELARDIVQDVFMRFLKEGPERLVGREAQWLYTVCRNRAYDMMRKSNRTVPLDDVHAATLTCPATLSPAAAAESGDSNRRVVKAMQTLPPKLREVVMLKFQAGLSYKEIADVTGLTVNHVGVLLHNALQKLRDELRDDLALEGTAASPATTSSAAAVTTAAATAAPAAKWSTK
ncbi:MAG TPA: sigma-70 family RNA polymerase sigma factor [Candidatus Methylacidiphilales bacterium]|nr:sigma-70 family RNA polymerase sigma factor [Candidatus Methylacidiphilales bacterium]